jgi:hypothetical protein
MFYNQKVFMLLYILYIWDDKYGSLISISFHAWIVGWKANGSRRRFDSFSISC